MRNDNDIYFNDEPELYDDAPEKGMADKLQEQLGTAPWWVVSVVFHALILLILSIIVIAVNHADDLEDSIIMSEKPPIQKKEEKNDKRKFDIVENNKVIEHDVVVENPVIMHEEVTVTENVQTENDMDLNSAKGQEDAISDIPLGGQGVSAAKNAVVETETGPRYLLLLWSELLSG